VQSESGLVEAGTRHGASFSYVYACGASPVRACAVMWCTWEVLSRKWKAKAIKEALVVLDSWRAMEG